MQETESPPARRRDKAMDLNFMICMFYKFGFIINIGGAVL
jgi:hypothetical protein